MQDATIKPAAVATVDDKKQVQPGGIDGKAKDSAVICGNLGTVQHTGRRAGRREDPLHPHRDALGSGRLQQDDVPSLVRNHLNGVGVTA